MKGPRAHGGRHAVVTHRPGEQPDSGGFTFTGSLADDPTVQRIVANVLDECRDPSLAAGQ